MSGLKQNGPSVLQMFTIAFKVSMLSFGGGVSGWTFREFVNKHAWVTEVEFLSDMAAARILPGANSANVTAILGYRLLGVRGAIAGLAGNLIGPFCLVLAIFYLLRWFTGPAMDAVMQGAAAGAIGPVFYVMVRSIRHGGKEWYGALIIIATAAAVLAKFSLLLTVAVALCISFAGVRLFGRPDEG